MGLDKKNQGPDRVVEADVAPVLTAAGKWAAQTLAEPRQPPGRASHRDAT